MDNNKKEFLRNKLVDMKKQAENNFLKLKQSAHAQTLIDDFLREESENSSEIERIQYKNLGESDLFLNRVNEKIAGIMQEIETLNITRTKFIEYGLISEFTDLLLVEHESVNYYTVQIQKMINYKESILEMMLGRNDKIKLENDIESQGLKTKKLKWCDENYFSLMGLIELLVCAGYIPENSFTYCGAIAENLFLKKMEHLLAGNHLIIRKAMNIRRKDRIF